VRIVEGVTLSIAVLGAVLGVINTWRAIDSSRVKLKVLPRHAIPVGGAPSHIGFCIAVTNLSAFPVTVNEVGVLYRGNRQARSLH
jgi:hypothetical protein